MEYDFRTRLHKPLTSVGRSIEWGEAIRLLGILRRDSSSQFAAAIEGWDFPVSRETLATLDLFDLMHMANAKRRPKPHPGRPSNGKRRDRQTMGDTGGRTPEQVKSLLALVRDGQAYQPYRPEPGAKDN